MTPPAATATGLMAAAQRPSAPLAAASVGDASPTLPASFRRCLDTVRSVPVTEAGAADCAAKTGAPPTANLEPPVANPSRENQPDEAAKNHTTATPAWPPMPAEFAIPGLPVRAAAAAEAPTAQVAPTVCGDAQTMNPTPAGQRGQAARANPAATSNRLPTTVELASQAQAAQAATPDGVTAASTVEAAAAPARKPAASTADLDAACHAAALIAVQPLLQWLQAVVADPSAAVPTAGREVASRSGLAESTVASLCSGSHETPDALLAMPAVAQAGAQPMGADPGLVPATPAMAIPVPAAMPAVTTTALTPPASVPVPLPPVALDHAGWPQQMGEHIQWHLGQGVQEARIEVSPGDLGPVQVQLSMDDSGLRVHLSASHAQTRELLQGELPRLRDALQQAGVMVAEAGVGSGSGRHPPATVPAPRSGTRGDQDDATVAGTGTVVRVLRRRGLLDDYA